MKIKMKKCVFSKKSVPKSEPKLKKQLGGGAWGPSRWCDPGGPDPRICMSSGPRYCPGAEKKTKL